jgi:hypothetical protein
MHFVFGSGRSETALTISRRAFTSVAATTTGSWELRDNLGNKAVNTLVLAFLSTFIVTEKVHTPILFFLGLFLKNDEHRARFANIPFLVRELLHHTVLR